MKKVLMASASKAFLSRNETLLKNKGFQFFTAASGSESLKLHEQHQFDLILSDLELDDMDGCRLCSEVYKSENPQLAPVVLICHNSLDSISRVKQSDASAILLRPIDPTHLLITIGSFIDMQLARCKRVKFNAKVSCIEQGREFLSNSHDISVSGLLLESEHRLDIGSRLTCHFTLPDICEIRANAEIVRFYAAPSGWNIFYGVKFDELDFSSRNSINRHILSNSHLGVKQKTKNSIARSLKSSAEFTTEVIVHGRNPV